MAADGRGAATLEPPLDLEASFWIPASWTDCCARAWPTSGFSPSAPMKTAAAATNGAVIDAVRRKAIGLTKVSRAYRIHWPGGSLPGDGA